MLRNKESEGDKLVKKAAQLCKPSLWELRMNADWNAAAPIYEQAVTVYKSGGCWDKARNACEKAAECQEHLGSSWHAGKMIEKAAEIAKEQKDHAAVADLYSQAALLYFEAGRPQTGSEALFKAASKVEEPLPEVASELYGRAIEASEQDERFTSGPDLFRSAVAHELNRLRYDAAAALLLKYAVVCNEKGLNMSVCRSYLAAIVVWFYAENGKEAFCVYRDCSTVQAFQTSEEHQASGALLDAYRSADPEAIQSVVREHICFQFLDTAVGRLATKLPTGNVPEIAASLQSIATPIDTNNEDDDLT